MVFGVLKLCQSTTSPDGGQTSYAARYRDVLLAIQEPTIRMTLLEDYVRLLMKLGHPVEDLFTIYLNYHRSKLGDIIDKYQKLQALSDDEKEIIALSGSEEEVTQLRERQRVTSEYPLMQFMSMLEKVEA